MKRDLLKLQLRHLPLQDVEERLQFYKSQLQKELRKKGIHFDFHIWVSDDWFCPDGIPGFAVPFYLFHPELMKLHKQKTGLVEGRSDAEILKLMRHELGHAIDNAFGLRKNKERKAVFGDSKKEYPEFYSPQKYSRSYVNYLGDNYAQSHPDEDFAETFAYWLDPKKQWKKKKFSKVLTEKLKLMNQLMKELENKKPILKNKYRDTAIDKQKITLGEFYLRVLKQPQHQTYKKLDQNITKVFKKHSQDGIPVAQYLKTNGEKISDQLSEQEGVYQYETIRGLNILIRRVKSLGLRASRTDLKSKTPSLIQWNFRYLYKKDQLKFFL